MFGDAREYHITSTEFADGHIPVVAEAPFSYRIGTPLLVAAVNPLVKAVTPRWFDALVDHWARRDDVIPFYVINVAAALLFAILLLEYLRCFVDDALVRLILLVSWLAAWHAPTRWVYFNPVNVEPLFLVNVVAALIVIEQRRNESAWRAASLLIPLAAWGTLCRESMALLPVAFIASRHPLMLLRERQWRTMAIVALPLAASALAILWTRILVEPANPQFDSLAEPLRMLRTKSIDSWLLAWFFTYGPAAIALIAASARPVMRFLNMRLEMATWLAGVAVLGFIGGTDTERILGWAAPVVFAILGVAIMQQLDVLRRRPVLVAVLVVIQLASQRFFWPVPGGVDNSEPLALGLDWPSARAFADRVLVIDHFYANLFSYFGSRSLHRLTLAADVVLVGGLVVMLRRRRVAL